MKKQNSPPKKEDDDEMTDLFTTRTVKLYTWELNSTKCYFTTQRKDDKRHFRMAAGVCRGVGRPLAPLRGWWESCVAREAAGP